MKNSLPVNMYNMLQFPAHLGRPTAGIPCLLALTSLGLLLLGWLSSPLAPSAITMDRVFQVLTQL